MCFSAGASFTAGVLLTTIGTATLKKVHKPAQLAFALIPLFFAFQQFSEGVLWLTMGHSDFLIVQAVATYIFLILAQVVWPMLVPYAVLLIEKDKTRKKILIGLLAGGAVIALYNLYIFIFHGVHAQIVSNHIAYHSDFVIPIGKSAVVFYLIVTLAPLFVSTFKRMSILGVIITVSFVVSAVFYMQCLTSVWCFFAALISFVVYYIIRDAHREYHIDLLAAIQKTVKKTRDKIIKKH